MPMKYEVSMWMWMSDEGSGNAISLLIRLLSSVVHRDNFIRDRTLILNITRKTKKKLHSQTILKLRLLTLQFMNECTEYFFGKNCVYFWPIVCIKCPKTEENNKHWLVAPSLTSAEALMVRRSYTSSLLHQNTRWLRPPFEQQT